MNEPRPKPAHQGAAPTRSDLGVTEASEAEGVRPLEPGDLPRVAALLSRLLSGGDGVVSNGYLATLRRLFFEHPWYDPSLPSLVYVRGGTVVGFIGSQPRPLVFRGAPLRAVWSGPLVSDPDAGAPAGLLLMRAVLAGPQDVTLTDGANPEVLQMWERLGGRVSHLRGLAWMRLLRPMRGVGELLLRQRLPRVRRMAGPLWDGFDRVVAPAAGFRPSQPTETSSVSLRPAALASFRDAAGGADPRVALDAHGSEWLLREVERTNPGAYAWRLVLGRNGEPIGWYVAELPRRGVGRLLGMGAHPTAVRAVLDQFSWDAWDAGTAAVTGRVEAQLLEPLLAYPRLVVRGSTRVLVHGGDPSLVDALVAGEGDITRLDGEWWILSRLHRAAGTTGTDLHAVATPEP